MEGPERSDQDGRLRATASRLRIDAGAADVLTAFERAGIRALLLKGASTVRWLYAAGEPRTYLDCDLLIAPTDVTAAEQTLRSLGYAPYFDDRSMPSWWREHATPWVCHRNGLTIDLHRTLAGAGADLQTMWGVLSADADIVMVAGYPAPTLALPARALHVALHALQHGVEGADSMADLERALAVANDELWHQAALLARELEAMDAFAAGLRLVAAGVELTARLGLPPPQSVDAQLRASTPPPVALGLEQLARADGMRARAGIVWRKLVPPPDFIRQWDARAVESRRRLLWAYARRPGWILRRVPRGVQAWCRARRAIRAARIREER